jgi:hypothetical protein
LGQQVGAIVVIAANRLRRFSSPGGLCGKMMKIGRERISLGPKAIGSKVSSIPSLPPPGTESSDFESLNLLVKHFDSPADVEDQLYSRSLIYNLEIGLQAFSQELSLVRLF